MTGKRVEKVQDINAKKELQIEEAEREMVDMMK